jgi:DNA-binding response OmpR family regulator
LAEKILIVDDDREVLQYISHLLQREGFIPLSTTSGEEAISIADNEKPDLIISDLKMPIMDGVELCWMIRQNSTIPMVPFVFLTGYDDEDLQVNGFRAGADEYLIKPIKPTILLNIIQTLISRYRKLQEFDVKKKVSISGKTSEISQVEILQLLSSTGKTGILTVKEDNIEGKIFLRNGRIVNANIGASDGVEAANIIITNMDGEFFFSPAKVDIEDKIHLSTINLLMEACRRYDEKNKDASK